MTEAELARGIQRTWLFAKAVGIHQLFSDPSSLKASDEFKDLSASSAASYEEVYLSGLAGGQYNILLADYAYFQFAGQANAVRYAYYPNPFLGASRQAISELSELRAFVNEGVIDMDEFLHAVAELRYSQHPPLLRYENAPEQYVDLIHPCSHLHLGHHAENRWPVRRVLTPAAFSLLVLKLFYPEYWAEGAEIAGPRSSMSLDDALVAAKQESRLLPDDLFSRRAGRQFYFG